VNFTISKTEKVGGGWLVEAKHTVYTGETAAESPAGVWAFRTLDHARKFIGTVVQVDKRVRMTKVTDSLYTYKG
jgi:hypothetical protein